MDENKRKRYNEELTYEIAEDGYDIFNVTYSDEIPWITQHDPYAKLFVPNGTYEENCLAQLKEVTKYNA